MLGTRVKAGGVSVIPVTASSAAVVRGDPWKKQHTLDVSAWQAGEGEHVHTSVSVGTELQSCARQVFYPEPRRIRLLVSTPASMSCVRDVDDDQISSDINF